MVVKWGLKSLTGICAFAAMGSSLCEAAPLTKSNGCKPHFVGPLEFSANDDGRSLKLSKQYGFVDSSCVEWSVPATAEVDGASIPRVFWSITGGPLEGKYRKASVIHDWFCDRRTRPWQSVHRMFLEAMLVGGVEPLKANIMYLAVYYGGPRWSRATVKNSKVALGSCHACASVGAPTNNNSFAAKAKAKAEAALDRRTVVFDYATPEISSDAAVELARKIETGEVSKVEQIEALIDDRRQKTQACPTGFRLSADQKVCE